MTTQDGYIVPDSAYGPVTTSIQQLTITPRTIGSGVSKPTLATLPTPNIPMVFVGIIVLIVLYKLVIEHDKLDLKPGHVKIGVINWIGVGILALSFIVFSKLVVNKLNSNSSTVTAIKTFVNAA